MRSVYCDPVTLLHEQTALPGLQTDPDLHFSFTPAALCLLISVSRGIVIHKILIRFHFKRPIEGMFRRLVHKHQDLTVFFVMIDRDERRSRCERELSGSDLTKLFRQRFERNDRDPAERLRIFRGSALIIQDAKRSSAREPDRESFRGLCKCEEPLRHIVRARHEHRVKCHSVHDQPAVFERSPVRGQVPEHIEAYDIELNLIFSENAAYFLHGHAVSRPVQFAVVEYSDGCDVFSSVQLIAHPVRVFHELRKIRELGIVPPRIEVRRTVGIRELRHGKGVRDQMVNSSHKQMIQQMLHIAHAEPPAVGSEEFAHRATLFLRVQMSSGSAHFPERIVEELAVPFRHQLPLLLRSSEIVLTADHVDPCHILAFHSPEPVRGAETQPAVNAVVLHDVSDVLYAVGPAPLSDGTGKILRIQFGYAVHIVVADLRLKLFLRALRKEEREKGAVFFPVPLFQHLLRLIAPWKRHFLFAELRIKALLADISELGLVGEESGDRLPELRCVPGVVCFIDALDLRVGRHPVDHIDISRISAVRPRAVDHVNAPLSLGKLERDLSVPAQICQIHRLLVEYMPLVIAERHDGNDRIPRLLCVIDRIADLPEADRGLQHPLYIKRERAARPEEISRGAGNVLLFPLRVLLDQTVRITRGKMLVVQDPYLHIPLFRLIEDDVHIMPPSGTAEVLVGPCLHTDRPDTALCDFFDLLADHLFRLTAHP